MKLLVALLGLALLGLALLCCSASARRAEPESAPIPGVEERAPADVLIGVVAESGILLCDGSEQGRWIDLHHEIGFVRAVGGPDLGALEGRPVVAEGHPILEQEPVVPRHTGPCPPPMQLRADWIEGPRSVRVKRAEPPFPAFRVQAVRPFEGLEARLVDGTLEVEVRNALRRELEDVRVVVHYEGCHGKPGTRSRTEGVGSLAPGIVTKLAFPVRLRDPEAPPWRSTYRAHSVRLEASTPGVTFDLDLGVGSDGSAC